MSAILLLFVIGKVLRPVLDNMTWLNGRYHYTNDICLLSHRAMDLAQMALHMEASKVKFKIDNNINGQNIEGVDQFLYLGMTYLDVLDTLTLS